MLKHLDLFSGIGGFALAAEWAGFKTIGFVEIDKYCQQVLKKHWPDVKIVGDIRDVTKETFAHTEQSTWSSESDGRSKYKPNKRDSVGIVDCSGCRTKSKSGTSTATIEPITFITGGFPCQPFSVAGKRQGDRDDRYLWPEMLRVIKAYHPTWVLGENVGGIAGMELSDSLPEVDCKASEEMDDYSAAVLDGICADLEKIGYSVQPVIIPACAVNAWH